MDLKLGYQKLFNKAKALIKEDDCMEFYDETKPLYLETDASRVGLGAGLLQIRDGMNYPQDEAPNNNILTQIAFASKSLSSTERRYNIERKAWGVLHLLEKFHKYCFATEIGIIIDPKPLVEVFEKDMATLSQIVQCNTTKDPPPKNQYSSQVEMYS